MAFPLYERKAITFGVGVYGYEPLISKEEIEGFGAKALDFSFSSLERKW